MRFEQDDLTFRWSPVNGYVPSQTRDGAGVVSLSVQAGKDVWIGRDGRIRIFQGISQLSATNTGARVFRNDTSRMEIAGGLQDGGTRLPYAGFTRHPAGVLFYLSELTGQQVYQDGTAVTGLTTSSTARKLRVAIPDGGGGYNVYDAGLPALNLPSANVTQMTGGNRDMSGAYSVVIAQSRGEGYGAISNAEQETITVTTNQLLIELPALTNGATYVQIGGSRQNAPGGPWYKLRLVKKTLTGSVTVTNTSTSVTGSGTSFTTQLVAGDVFTLNSVDYTVQSVTSDTALILTAPSGADFTGTATLKKAAVQWRNGELGAQMDNTLAAPEVARGVVFWNDRLILWGVGISYSELHPSRRNNPEVFDVDDVVASTNSEAILNVLPGDVKLYVMTANTLQIVTFVGGLNTPLFARPVWDQGFAAMKNGAMADQTFYGFTGLGACRTRVDDSPDYEFARDVQTVMRGWTPANVTVGYCPKNLAVLYAYWNGSNTVVLPFRLATQRWNPELHITGRVVDIENIGSRAVMQILDGGNYRAYEFDAGAGAVSAYIVSEWISPGVTQMRGHLTGVRHVGKAQAVRLYTGNAENVPDVTSSGAARLTQTLPAGNTVSRLYPTSLTGAYNVAIRVDYNSQDGDTSSVAIVGDGEALAV